MWGFVAELVAKIGGADEEGRKSACAYYGCHGCWLCIFSPAHTGRRSSYSVVVGTPVSAAVANGGGRGQPERVRACVRAFVCILECPSCVSSSWRRVSRA